MSLQGVSNVWSHKGRLALPPYAIRLRDKSQRALIRQEWIEDQAKTGITEFYASGNLGLSTIEALALILATGNLVHQVVVIMYCYLKATRASNETKTTKMRIRTIFSVTRYIPSTTFTFNIGK